ncbi:MAG: hypothetical protein AB7F50_09390 [Fimbriimonadaceae bacterium]
MASKSPTRPVWWKNTFFLFGILLVVIALIGAVRGESAIRDPGQIKENGLVMINMVAAILMLVNGVVSHRLAVQAYEEATGPED